MKRSTYHLIGSCLGCLISIPVLVLRATLEGALSAGVGALLGLVCAWIFGLDANGVAARCAILFGALMFFLSASLQLWRWIPAVRRAFGEERLELLLKEQDDDTFS